MKFHYTTTKDSYQYELAYPDLGYSIFCTVHFSKRKSISIRLDEGGNVTVRAPYYVSANQVERFVESKKNWIYLRHKDVQKRVSILVPLTPEEEKQAAFLEKQFRKAAKAYIPSRVAYFHTFTNGSYTSISIRDQKSRWGSCSSRGSLSFNYRLMLAPPSVLDYVVVHELCHLTHMNHSKDFWSMVETVLPNYKESKKWLKNHGQELTIAEYLKKATSE